ncbi:aryl-sulfate sulfotransferase [bacterium]|nr:aryl-sulfate sulfotransferase [bacterium]
MKIRQWLCLFFLALNAAADAGEDFSYVYPFPNSDQVSPHTTLIFKSAPEQIKHLILNPGCITVSGSVGGACQGTVTGSDAANTCIFKPARVFQEGETVTVILATARWGMPDRSYCFRIARSDSGREQTGRFQDACLKKTGAAQTGGSPRIINGVAVPGDFPTVRLIQNGETAPGRLFLGQTFPDDAVTNFYLLVLNEDGTPYFFRRGREWRTGDFKVQPGNRLSVFRYWDRKFILFNDHFEETDSYKAGHNYATDNHDLVLLPDGHALIIGMGSAVVDLSGKVPGGRKNTFVDMPVLQELDTAKNVIFEWRTLDHVHVEDAVYEDLTGFFVDFSHLNSVAVDYDGNLIISQRHQSEVSKIDRETGAFIWRLGGQHNQFTFVNDPEQIRYQHHCRPVPGQPGHYTIYDNGNHRSPQRSRAVEYRIDTDAMTAEKVWEYRFPPDGHFNDMMGSVQVLPNGNRLIDGCARPPYYGVEVSPQNELLAEMIIDEISSYRTMRFEWQGLAEAPDLFAVADREKIILGFNKFGDTDIDHYRIYADETNPPVTLLATSGLPLFETRDLKNRTTYYFQVAAVAPDGSESQPSNIVSVTTDLYDFTGNIVHNGSFDGNAAEDWTLVLSNGAQASGSVTDGVYGIRISSAGFLTRDIQLVQNPVPLTEGSWYRFEFDARAAEPRNIDGRLEKGTAPFALYKQFPAALEQEFRHFAFDYQMNRETNESARVAFYLGQNDKDVFIDNIRLREMTETGISGIPENLPVHFSLKQNHPNPFNMVTEIAYEVNRAAAIRIVIRNLQGQEAAVLKNALHQPGQYRVLWDGRTGDLHPAGSGIYFLTLESENRCITRKLMLLK